MDNLYKKALKKIENAQKCKPSNFVIVGPTGPEGPMGPTGAALKILGSFESKDELINFRPTGNL